VEKNFLQTDTVNVGALPHGLWPSADGRLLYVGLEYGDEVQAINLLTMKALPPVQIGQSPQALVYADNAVTDPASSSGLTPLTDTAATQVLLLKGMKDEKGIGRIAVRSNGLADLVEQIFTALKPNASYTLALTRSGSAPFTADYEINKFDTDGTGKNLGQSTGLVKVMDINPANTAYRHVILLDNETGRVVLMDNLSDIR
jgi:DNA-binding beta-propeller fold protein YncE